MPDAGRVITGSAGGRRLEAPGSGTRPLSDRVKQSLFSGLEAEVAELWERTCLDLFAGSGAAGIEAMSRGAPRAVFVERDGRAAAVIGRNLASTGLAASGRVVRRDVAAFLRDGAATFEEAPFGCVILDPPYEDVEALLDALDMLGAPGTAWLEDDAVVAAKHFWRDEPPARAGDLHRVRQRRFGETALSVYRRQPQLATGATP